MSRSESDIDLAKYMPSLEAMREQADERAAQERMRKALDNPALDAALEEYRSEAATIPNPPLAAPALPSAPPTLSSPWTASKPGDDAIDKALLPSANAPAAAPVTTLIAEEVPGPPVKSLSPTQKSLAAIGLAFLPAMLVFVLFVKPAQPVASGAPVAPSPTAPPIASSAAEPVTAVRSAAPVPMPMPSPAMSAAPTAPAVLPSAAVPKIRRPAASPTSVPGAPAAPEPAVTVTPPTPPSSSPPPPKPEIID